MSPSNVFLFPRSHASRVPAGATPAPRLCDRLLLLCCRFSALSHSQRRGHVGLELLAASACFVSHQCRASVRTNFRATECRVWPAVAQDFPSIAVLLPILSCNLASPWSPWVYATDASGRTHSGHGVTRRRCDPVDVAAAGRCAERWKFPAEEFISAGGSVQLESEQRACKALWLAVDDAPEKKSGGLASVPGGERASRLSVNAFRSRYLRKRTIPHRSAQVCLECSVWWWGKLISWSCVTHVAQVKSLGKRIWTVWPWCSALQRAAAVLPLSTTLVACAISLVTFTTSVCRWTASEENLADATVLSAEAAGMASEEAPPQKHSCTRSFTGLAGQNRRGTATNPSSSEAAILASQHPFFDESSFLQRNRVTVATVQR